VPAILREQGAIGIPADCYPVDADTPLFTDLYWGYGQNLLRAAHQVRRSPGVYALYCSNYSCGPDSFNLHFAAYTMEGKPFAVIETDGHSGDAGTRTRVEAFLHCVEENRRTVRAEAVVNDFASVQFTGLQMTDVRTRHGPGEHLLVPYIGVASETVAAAFRGLGFDAECLPAPDPEALRLGRRYTSGKECLPMPLTLGTLLQRLEQARPDDRFVYLMPCADGPCRFGVYNLLNRIVLGRLRWRNRLRIWSPNDARYFDGMPPGIEMLMLAGMMTGDLLRQAQYDTRPGERASGAASTVYARHHAGLLRCVEAAARGDLSLGPALWQVASGRLFGLGDLLESAGREFAAQRGAKDHPLVELTGEIYVRSVDFSNDFIIERLEERGLRVRLSPMTEWLNYCAFLGRRTHGNRPSDRLSGLLQQRIETAAFAAIARHLGWPERPTINDALEAARPYVSDALEGEAVLTVGTPLHQWRHKQIDGVVNVGPLECMPTKIAEAQFYHVAERDGLPSLTLPFNGDPINSAALDNFAFEVKAGTARRKAARPLPWREL
jgi:predicted nucleotide-binding protein (sugar kinase/HSP70/actin superfamily)